MSPMTRPDLLSDWTITPAWWAVMAVTTALYLIGVRRAAHRSPTTWPVYRTLSWFGAMVILVVALNSGVAMYSHHLFWVHMLVHLMLIMVIPLLLVVAQPIRLGLDTLGPTGAQRLRGFMTHRVTRFFTSPAFSVPLYAAVLVGTHLTGFQQAMSENMWIHETESVVYLVSGYLLLLPTIGGEFSGHDLSHPVRFVTLLISMGPDTLVGVILMLTDRPIAPAYGESRMGWGPSALADQNIAGAIMWFGGDGLMMLLLVLVAGQWIRAETHPDPDRPRRQSWLDSARRSATMGEDGESDDIDSDEAALAAYNARLAKMYGDEPASRRR
ncbi:hypothetical protein GCM10007298_08670 [Williamsia phyllosphaerae]|uniref:Cytochrome c oxidase assembly protein n=2 Tax=Williamsia phyllosphaerae TaxID=885042 RepID=A0ABQ1UED5_9NOCA|nr:hypothetical protein GCM10007298_08670 [Williamsia phyllosphaerae]